MVEMDYILVSETWRGLSRLICIGPVPCDFNQDVTIRLGDSGSGFTVPPNIFNLGRENDNTDARCVGAIFGVKLPEGETGTIPNPTS
jgi:hypothetical protein